MAGGKAGNRVVLTPLPLITGLVTLSADRLPLQYFHSQVGRKTHIADIINIIRNNKQYDKSETNSVLSVGSFSEHCNS